MRSGLSLAMSSANSVMMKRKRKIHSEISPRRLALKLRRRCLLTGESVKTEVTPVIAKLCSTARFKINARINPGVSQITDKGNDQT